MQTVKRQLTKLRQMQWTKKRITYTTIIGIILVAGLVFGGIKLHDYQHFVRDNNQRYVNEVTPTTNNLLSSNDIVLRLLIDNLSDDTSPDGMNEAANIANDSLINSESVGLKLDVVIAQQLNNLRWMTEDRKDYYDQYQDLRNLQTQNINLLANLNKYNAHSTIVKLKANQSSYNSKLKTFKAEQVKLYHHAGYSQKTAEAKSAKSWSNNVTEVYDSTQKSTIIQTLTE